MKTKLEDGWPGTGHKQPGLFRLMTYMFLSCFILCMSGQAYGYAQKQAENVKLDNVPMTDALQELSKIFDCDFLYDYNLISRKGNVTLHSKNKTLDEILIQLLPSYNLRHSFDGQIVIIREGQQKDKTEGSLRITGKVKDEEGTPLPGVTVMVKGTSLGTFTDAEGKYTLQMRETEKLVLVFSFIGKETKEIPFKGQKRLDVTLRSISSEMDEVVAVGYGTTKVKDMTGAVSRLGKDDIKNAPMGSNIQSMLQGKASGVNVMIGSASPTSPVSVVIRGASSLSGNSQPLWVIDGVPEYTAGTSGNVANTLYNLNLTDVESIDILKDASATAIYGSRAANGVIIVTTKRGQAGMKPQLEFSARYGIQVMDANGFDMMNADEYKKFSKASLVMNFLATGKFGNVQDKYLDQEYFNKHLNHSQFNQNTITDEFYKDDAFGDGNCDWWKLMTQNAATQDYSLAIRGGSKASSYNASIFYKDQKGIVKGGKSKMLGANFNFDAAVNSMLRFKMNLKASARNTENKDNLVLDILQMRPDVAPYNEDGSINMVARYVKNPLLTQQDTHEGKGKDFTGTLGLEWDIVKGLTLRTTGTFRYSSSKNEDYVIGWYDGVDSEGSISKSENHTYVWDNTLSYINTWGKHKLVGLVGLSLEKHKFEDFEASAQGYPDDDILTNLGSAAQMNKMNSGYEANTLASGFSRLEYKYNDRYLFTLNFRADGSSKFGPDTRWGYFPSGAVAWILSEEKFMQNISGIVSYLKLRASIGKTGSQNLGNYTWRNLMAARKYYGAPGIVPETLGNDNLQWEEQIQKEFGMDFGFWQDRIRGSFGLYEKKVDNLLYTDPVAPSSSFLKITQNIGSLKNRGVEFDIQMDVVKNVEKDLTWNVDFNVSRNRTTLEKLNNSDDHFGGTFDWFRVPVGGETGKFFYFQDAGRLFMTHEEVASLHKIDPKTGKILNYRNWRGNESKGDIYVVDQDGDGVIDGKDKDHTYIGNANPDFQGGFGTTLHWKGFMFNATFSYSVGGERFWHQEMNTLGDMGVNNASTMILDSWTMAPGKNIHYPRAMFGDLSENMTITNRFIHDASYLRLNALNFAYRLPKHLYKNCILNSLEFTFQATNLFTWTKYPGMDPQGNFEMDDTALKSMGVDYSTYPSARTYNVGVKLTLK